MITTNSNITSTPTATVKRGPGRPKTKLTLRRVVLLDGVPVGKGRPAAESKSNRTVVYVPVGEAYDVAKHGTGTKFRPGLAQFSASIKRVDLKSAVKDGVKAVKKVKAKATPEVAPIKAEAVVA